MHWVSLFLEVPFFTVLGHAMADGAGHSAAYVRAFACVVGWIIAMLVVVVGLLILQPSGRDDRERAAKAGDGANVNPEKLHRPRRWRILRGKTQSVATWSAPTFVENPPRSLISRTTCGSRLRCGWLALGKRGDLSQGPWLHMENRPRWFGPALDRSARAVFMNGCTLHPNGHTLLACESLTGRVLFDLRDPVVGPPG